MAQYAAETAETLCVIRRQAGCPHFKTTELAAAAHTRNTAFAAARCHTLLQLLEASRERRDLST
jgi:hypothetical protein